MNKLFQGFHAILFTLLISTPLLMMVISKGNTLAFSQISQNFDDQFGFRKELITLQSYLTVQLFGDSPRDNVILGRDGWYFRGRGRQRLTDDTVQEYDYVSDDTAESTTEDLFAWKQVLEERQNYLAERGIPYLFFIAPKKALIYPEHLPDSLRERQEKNSPTFLERLNQFLATESSVPTIDLVSILRAAKLERPSENLYLKTDGHWNSIGAFVAYQAVMERVQELLPETEISILQRQDFETEWKQDWAHQGFSQQLGFPIVEPFPKLLPLKGNPMRSSLLTSKEWKRAAGNFRDFWLIPNILDHNKRHITASLSDSSGKPTNYTVALNRKGRPFSTMLLLGDSFLMKLFPFFSVHSTALLRLRSERDFPTQYFKTNTPKPEIVIQEVSQRYLGVKAPQNNFTR